MRANKVGGSGCGSLVVRLHARAAVDCPERSAGSGKRKSVELVVPEHAGESLHWDPVAVLARFRPLATSCARGKDAITTDLGARPGQHLRRKRPAPRTTSLPCESCKSCTTVKGGAQSALASATPGEEERAVERTLSAT